MEKQHTHTHHGKKHLNNSQIKLTFPLLAVQGDPGML
jgi:hypothetical protein